MRHTFLLSLCLSSIVLTGCSTLGSNDERTAPEPEQKTESPAAEPAEKGEAESAPEPEETVERSFEPNILYGLLAAEMAAERGRYDITLINYVEAAKRTRDPGVMRRALQFAQGLGANNAQYQVAKIWLESEPDNVDPLRIAAVQAIKHGDLEAARRYMDRIYAQGKRADFDNLGTYAATLSPEKQEALISTFKSLRSEYPERNELSFNLAILQYTAGRPEEAIATLEPILDREPEYQPAIALYSTLVFETGERDKALTYLRSQSRRYPESIKLGTLYARMLVDAEQLQAAQDQFQRLLKKAPDSASLRLSYALVALENNQTELAREQLQASLDHGETSSDAHFYLGRLAEQEGNKKEALRHYSQVERGGQFFSALTRSGELLAEQGELDAALARLAELRQRHPNQAERLWLVQVNLLDRIDRPQQALAAASEAIAAFPESVNLRYARAMINDQQNSLTAAEEDLRWIIEHDPENAVALNALGYTLTLKTDRYDEALDLIQRAHELAPNNPAILDSLGWIHFKRGDLQLALDYLSRAYETFSDAEVAAHLGEVLWSLGRKNDARRIWDHAREEDPDDQTLNETLERLGAEQEED